MEDSLGLPAGTRIAPTAGESAVPAIPAVPSEPAASAAEGIDSELTLDPTSFLGIAAAQARPGAPTESSLPPPTGSAVAPNGPPQPSGSAMTGAPSMPSRELRRMVQVRRCHRQHVNPLTAALCRQCREPIDPRAPVESVTQPALGALLLPDDTRVPIDGPIVLGRKPDPDSARVTEPAAIHSLDAGSDVSRTHLVVRATGWTMEAVDCASSGHTVLVPGNGADPVELQPWVPHELMPGDTLYLGGPTQVRVIA